MKRYLIASLLILTAGMTLEAKPEVRFKEKGIKTKYDKKLDAMIYSAKWGQGSHKDNPLSVKIVEYGENAGEWANTSWLQISIERSGNGYVGMEYIKFYYPDIIRGEKVDLKEISSVQKSVNFNLGSDTFSDYWSRQFRGELAKEWAERFIRLSKTGSGRTASSFIKIYGEGAFYDSYHFTKKDKANLKALGTAWLKYFDK